MSIISIALFAEHFYFQLTAIGAHLPFALSFQIKDVNISF